MLVVELLDSFLVVPKASFTKMNCIDCVFVNTGLFEKKSNFVDASQADINNAYFWFHVLTNKVKD